MASTISLFARGRALVLFASLAAPSLAAADSPKVQPPRRSVGGYLEVFGSGGYGTLNGEYMPSRRIALRLGVGMNAAVAMFSLCAGGCEIGAGPVLVFRSDMGAFENWNIPTLTVGGFLGFRLRIPGNILLRLGWTPVFHRGQGSPGPDSWFGLSFGYSGPLD